MILTRVENEQFGIVRRLFAAVQHPFNIFSKRVFNYYP